MTLSVEVIIASFDEGMDLILFVLNDARDLCFLMGLSTYRRIFSGWIWLRSLLNTHFLTIFNGIDGSAGRNWEPKGL